MFNRMKKYHQYFTLVAGIMIFGSWVVSSQFAEKLKATETKLSEFQNVHSLYETLSSMTYRQISQTQNILNISNSVHSIHKMTERAQPGWQKSNEDEPEPIIATKFNEVIKSVKRADAFSHYIRTLTKISSRTTQFSKSIDIDTEFKEQIFANEQESKDLAVEFNKKRQSFYVKMKKLFKKGISVEDVTQAHLDELSPLAKTYSDYHRSIIETQYRDLQAKIKRTKKQLLAEAESQAKVATYWANISGKLAIIMYILGTLLAIAGKWLEVKEEKGRKIWTEGYSTQIRIDYEATHHNNYTD